MKFNKTGKLFIELILFYQDFLGKSDPYLEISKRAADGSWQVVHRTEVSQAQYISIKKT